MIRVRPSQERGFFDHGWLKTYHTFSFGDYHDPRHMAFRTLRVINEDYVLPGQGFPTHSHRDMEILTYLLEGQLEHKDSMGNSSVIHTGEVQRMSAGSGVTHSEYNASQKEKVHLLQIWILPDQKGLNPGYEQKLFPNRSKTPNILRLIASKHGEQASVSMSQDVFIYDGLIQSSKSISYDLQKGRAVWIQIIRGKLEVGKNLLQAGDGASVELEDQIKLTAKEDAEILLFDLA